MSHPTSANGFVPFNLHSDLMKGIHKAGFTQPRPIQAATLPDALKGSDILGLAQTGTGKTAGFAIPIIERILRHKTNAPSALILAPTRELAAQITAEIQQLAAFTPIRSVTIYGGVGQGPQVAKLRKNPDIIIACPGRLLDLMGQGFVKLRTIETLVLDEADHMFDMGFLVPIRKILKELPSNRQNLLFSATMPKEIRKLADDLLDNPSVVELPTTKPVDLITQVVYPVHERRKLPLLEHLLHNDSVSKAIIFTRTKRRAKTLADKLGKASFNAAALQGNMSQNARDRAIKGFKGGEYDILVATDIAARGIDVSKVSHVINYDVPDTAEAYTHRIGRTGRAECTGKACTFLTTDGREMLRAIERRIQQDIPQEVIEEFMKYDGPEPVRQQQAKPNNRRPSTPKAQPQRSRRRPNKSSSSDSQGQSARGGQSSSKPRNGAKPQGTKAGQGQRTRSNEQRTQGSGGPGARPASAKLRRPRRRRPSRPSAAQ